MLIVGQDVTCPHCWEQITVTLDLSEPEQEYVEDCFVCCRPLVIHYVADGLEVREITVRAESE